MWKSPVGAQESQPRLVYKAELKTLLSLYRALVLSILIAPWESSSRRLQKKIARWRFSSSQTLVFYIAVVSSLCYVVFCFAFVAEVVLISYCRLCVFFVASFRFAPSAVQHRESHHWMPEEARDRRRSETVIISLFFLIIKYFVFLLVLGGVRVLCFQRKLIYFVKRWIALPVMHSPLDIFLIPTLRLY